MKTNWAALGAISCLWAMAAQPAAAGPAQVDQALSYIRAACGIANTSLDVKPTPEGRLELRVALADGRRGAVALVNRDLDGFTDRSTAVVASQGGAQGACLDQYVNEVISTLVTLPANVASAPVALPNYNPPPMAAPPAPPPMAAPAPAPAPAPPRPAMPATGDLPVGVVNGTSQMAQASAQRAAGVSFRIAGCRAAGPDVVCEVKVDNTSGQDTRVTTQGAYSKLYGADGSEINASWVVMGNQRDDMRYGSHQSVVKVIADTAPVMGVVFTRVPVILSSIKRLEISVGAQTVDSPTQMQKLTLADVPIQGR
jgi:hypothetical protein